MSKVRLIGDIHGAFGYYRHLVDGAEASVQVGDYGLGFNSEIDEDQFAWSKLHPQHKFIRGNHDSKLACQAFDNYLFDGGVDHQNKIMYIGGAWSIDYFLRREGRSYWTDEENSQDDFDRFEKTYKAFSPRVMITHDAPHGVPEKLGLLNPDFGGSITTRTGFRLARLLHIHKPELWVFGHWHKSADQMIDGTRFVCLNINEVRDLDLNTLELT